MSRRQQKYYLKFCCQCLGVEYCCQADGCCDDNDGLASNGTTVAPSGSPQNNWKSVNNYRDRHEVVGRDNGLFDHAPFWIGNLLLLLCVLTIFRSAGAYCKP